jgi:hypothetical protein
VTLNELKSALTAIIRAKRPNSQDDGFKEVRRRKRYASDETSQTSKKAALPTTAEESTGSRGKLVTRKFASLRSTDMDRDSSGTESQCKEQLQETQRDRPL